MQRVHYTDDHLAFGDLARDFAVKVVAPQYENWESAGIVPR
ncbi:acyl-CoA dehydrogenase, partial [Mycobacterium sp. ITM-2017-0098]